MRADSYLEMRKNDCQLTQEFGEASLNPKFGGSKKNYCITQEAKPCKFSAFLGVSLKTRWREAGIWHPAAPAPLLRQLEAALRGRSANDDANSCLAETSKYFWASQLLL